MTPSVAVRVLDGERRSTGTSWPTTRGGRRRQRRADYLWRDCRWRTESVRCASTSLWGGRSSRFAAPTRSNGSRSEPIACQSPSHRHHSPPPPPPPLPPLLTSFYSSSSSSSSSSSNTTSFPFFPTANTTTAAAANATSCTSSSSSSTWSTWSTWWTSYTTSTSSDFSFPTTFVPVGPYSPPSPPSTLESATTVGPGSMTDTTSALGLSPALKRGVQVIGNDPFFSGTTTTSTANWWSINPARLPSHLKKSLQCFYPPTWGRQKKRINLRSGDEENLIRATDNQ